MQNRESTENSLRQYISIEKNGNFNKVLAKDERFEIFYHLSETRRSLLNWYEFKKDSRLLEVGGEYGALTGLFCDRCASVTCLTDSGSAAELVVQRYKRFSNLTVTENESLLFQNHEQFDYIVIVGQLEYAGDGSKGKKEYVDYLTKWTALLKQGGTLLLAVENRYGIRYFCGERDPFTNLPFAGLNRYPDGSPAYPLSRQELIEIVEELPNMKYKFYYPVPDYRFPQMIFTDEYLPKSNLRERIIPYYKDSSTLVMNESKLYDDIADNGVFPFFSNSFLIECTRSGAFCSVAYAALSTDRGKKYGFATTLDCRGQAKKTALYSEGIESLRKLKANIEDMQSHGVAVVPHRLCGDRIEMPSMDLPTLSEYLKIAVRRDPNEFIKLFDQLFEQILKSSEHVPAEENRFQPEKNRPYLKGNELSASNTGRALPDWGIILKRSYIDMIPVNCFFDGKKMIFYDQEFVRECFPAGYTMYRALKYTYQFLTFVKGIVPLRDMQERYYLADVWDYYQEEERRFVADNRDYKTYGNYMKWSKLNGKILKGNIKRLMREEPYGD